MTDGVTPYPIGNSAPRTAKLSCKFMITQLLYLAAIRESLVHCLTTSPDQSASQAAETILQGSLQSCGTRSVYG